MGQYPIYVTWYVSNTASNGFILGVDTYDGMTKGTPFLTLTKALSVCNDGDIILLNSGTYTETLSMAVNKAVSIDSAIAYGAIIKVAGGQTKIFTINAAGSGSTIGRVVLDGNAACANGILGDATTAVPFFGIDGTTFQNFTGNAIDTMTKVRNLTISGGWTINCGAAVSAMNITPDAASNIVIKNGTINATSPSGATWTGVSIAPTITGCTLVIDSITYNITGNAVSTTFNAIFTAGCSKVSVTNSNFTYTGGASSTNLYSIYTTNHATITCTSYVVNNNTIQTPGYSQFGIFIGDYSAPTTANNIQNCVVSNNTIKNTGQAIFVGYITGAQIFHSTFIDCSSGITSRQCTNNVISYNYGYFLTGYQAGTTVFALGAVSCYGDTGTKVYNNTFHCAASTSSIGIKTAIATANCSGLVVRNNLITAANSAGLVYVNSAASNPITTISNNLYFGSTNANPWVYLGTNYSAVGTWAAAASDTNYVTSDPLLTSDFRMNFTSPAYKTGVNVSLTSDFTGSAITNPPSIGAFDKRFKGTGNTINSVYTFNRLTLDSNVN